MKMKIVMGIVGLVLGLMLLIQADKMFLFVISLGVMLLVIIVLGFMKKINRWHAFIGAVAYFSIFILLSFYILPTYAISVSQGTVLSNNWWEGLNWVRNNTDNCAVIATYWDPGHFITGIAHRHVIYDGASQGWLLELNSSETSKRGVNVSKYSEGTNIEKYDKGAIQVVLRNGDSVTTARMKDVAISLFTDNESLAVELLKKYMIENCSEMYFIASSDLIYKSQWWTYFATWDPAKVCEGQLCKGTMYNYAGLQMSRRKPLIFANVVGYEYPVSQRQSIILYEQNDTIKALFQQDNQFVKIQRVVYQTNIGIASTVEPNAEIQGTILIIDPSMSMIFFIPPQLDNAMFTRMFFFNGAGMKNFEFIKDWGGEVKLFRIKLNETG